MRDDLFFERVKAGMDAAFTRPCEACEGTRECTVCNIFEYWKKQKEEVDKDALREAGMDPDETAAQVLSVRLLGMGWPASYADQLILGGTCPACANTNVCKSCDGKGRLRTPENNTAYLAAMYTNCIESIYMLREKGRTHAADILFEKTYAFLLKVRKETFAEVEAQGGFKEEQLESLRRAMETLDQDVEPRPKLRVVGGGLTHEEMVELGLIEEEE